MELPLDRPHPAPPQQRLLAPRPGPLRGRRGLLLPDGPAPLAPGPGPARPGRRPAGGRDVRHGPAPPALPGGAPRSVPFPHAAAAHLAAGFVLGSGAYFPYWVTTDSFTPFALAAGGSLWLAVEAHNRLRRRRRRGRGPGSGSGAASSAPGPWPGWRSGCGQTACSSWWRPCWPPSPAPRRAVGPAGRAGPCPEWPWCWPGRPSRPGPWPCGPCSPGARRPPRGRAGPSG